ncbi:hypothetical protein ES705_10556 [subsurface metagenome]
MTKTKTNRSYKRFEFWDDAFDYCRGRNCPVIVIVKGKKMKLFPSGYVVYFDKQGREIKRRKRRR